MLYNLKNISFYLLLFCIAFSCLEADAKTKNYLSVFYPKDNQVISADSTFFVGETNPKSNLTINDSSVNVYSDGAFVHVYKLAGGTNNIELKSVLNNDIMTKKINITVPDNTNNTNTPNILQGNEASLIVTEVEAPLRKSPYGDRLTPVKQGMICKSVGILNNHYKVKYQNGYAYILKNFVKISPQNMIDKQTSESIFFNEDSKNIIVKVSLQQPTLVSISNKSNNLNVKFDNTELKFQQVLTKSPYIKSFTFNGDSFDIQLDSENIYGYDYYYEGNIFVLKLHKPFRPGLSGKVIAVDAGHGGTESGAVGPTGIPEKDINILISNYLRDELEKSGAKVIMTREDNNTVGLYERVEIAQKHNADILVSIHNNSLPDGQDPYIIHGTSTYYFQPQAVSLAKSVQNNLVLATKFKDLGIKYGSFVLTRPTSPVSILIEVGFMINPDEYRALQVTSNQKKYAKAIVKGIEEYFAK